MFWQSVGNVRALGALSGFTGPDPSALQSSPQPAHGPGPRFSPAQGHQLPTALPNHGPYGAGPAHVPWLPRSMLGHRSRPCPALPDRGGPRPSQYDGD